MPFERPTIETIKDRIEKGIEARIFGKIALLRNAVLRILARVFAGAIHGNYGYLTWLTQQIFVTTAEGMFLDNPHGRMWRIQRRPGSFASGSATFTGVDGSVIPADTRIQSEAGVEYGTLTIATIIGGSVSVDIQAVESGIVGNFVLPDPPNPATFQMISPIAGVNDEIAITADITGGEDTEDDETYRARILQRIQTIPTGGSAADYVRWALEVPGVARAWCYPLSNGPGTVTTVITASGNDPVPSPNLISDVQAYIEERRPVTANHNVASIMDHTLAPGKTVIDFLINIPSTSLNTEVEGIIENNIRTLFLPQRPGTYIKISQVRAAIFNSGVSDYDIVSIIIGGSSYYPDEDIPLKGYQYPWLGTIGFSELT